MIKRKITLELLKQEAEQRGWKILSTEYINMRTKLIFQCSCGYIFKALYWVIYNLKKCPGCAKNRRVHIEDIKRELDKKNWILLSTEFTGVHQKIKCICDQGHEQEISWEHIRKNQNCSICSRNKKYTKEDAIRIIQSKGWKLLSEYKARTEWIICECDKGHKITTTLGRISVGIGCKYCNGGVKLEYDFVKNIFAEKGFTLISTAYVDNHAPLQIECPNGHIFTTSLAYFKANLTPCGQCRKPYYSETIIREYLNEHTGYVWKMVFPKWLRIGKSRYQLDAYCEELKIAVEIQGRQHFEYPNIFHKDKASFDKQQANDEYKRQKCKEMGIILLEVRAVDYYGNKNDMINALKELLAKYIK